MEQIFFHGLLSSNISIRQSTISLMIIYICLIFVLGGLNNLFTFLTFYRSKFLRHGIGNYLFVGSVINQLTLMFLSFRLLLVILGARGSLTTINMIVNKILCKSVAYGLSSAYQLSYWLMSTIAIERLYITWRIKGTWLKKSYVARRIICVLTIIILIFNIPQILFYSAIHNSEMDMHGTACILVFPSLTWTHLNQINSYINNLMPLMINIICTIGIIYLIIKQKLHATKKTSTIIIDEINNGKI